MHTTSLKPSSSSGLPTQVRSQYYARCCCHSQSCWWHRTVQRCYCCSLDRVVGWFPLSTPSKRTAIGRRRGNSRPSSRGCTACAATCGVPNGAVQTPTSYIGTDRTCGTAVKGTGDLEAARPGWAGSGNDQVARHTGATQRRCAQLQGKEGRELPKGRTKTLF